MENLINLNCIIFAGGKSSRMGRDKALLEFKGKTLIKYQFDRLSLIFDRVYISTKNDKFDFKAPLILDSSKIFAPTPAFLDIFKLMDQFFAISVDTPFIDKEIIKKILDEAKNHKNCDAIIAKTNFPHPLIGIYRKSIVPIIKKAIKNKNYRLNHILKEAKTHFVEFRDEDRFFNCNYPEDFKKALKMC